MSDPTRTSMTALEAAYQVLKSSGEPMPVTEITRRILLLGLWKTNGSTPARTVAARIGEEISQKGEDSRFVRVGVGVFALKKLPETCS